MALVTLSTVVNNTSGASRYFGFLGRHGVTLDAGEEFRISGDLIAKLSALPRKVKYNALVAELEAGNLALVSTPSQHYFDPTREETKILAVENGAVVIDDPEAGAYSSSHS